MPEIIDDGVTGFVVDDAAQAADAVRSVAALDRATCRSVAERRFGVERMVQDYVAVYDQILRGGGG
jgi:glycosyltransferase involved in cell wall biosynthesis